MTFSQMINHLADLHKGAHFISKMHGGHALHRRLSMKIYRNEHSKYKAKINKLIYDYYECLRMESHIPSNLRSRFVQDSQIVTRFKEIYFGPSLYDHPDWISFLATGEIPRIDTPVSTTNVSVIQLLWSIAPELHTEMIPYVDDVPILNTMNGIHTVLLTQGYDRLWYINNPNYRATDLHEYYDLTADSLPLFLRKIDHYSSGAKREVFLSIFPRLPVDAPHSLIADFFGIHVFSSHRLYKSKLKKLVPYFQEHAQNPYLLFKTLYENGFLTALHPTLASLYSSECDIILERCSTWHDVTNFIEHHILPNIPAEYSFDELPLLES